MFRCCFCCSVFLEILEIGIWRCRNHWLIWHKIFVHLLLSLSFKRCVLIILSIAKYLFEGRKLHYFVIIKLMQLIIIFYLIILFSRLSIIVKYNFIEKLLLWIIHDLFDIWDLLRWLSNILIDVFFVYKVFYILFKFNVFIFNKSFIFLGLKDKLATPFIFIIWLKEDLL